MFIIEAGETKIEVYLNTNNQVFFGDNDDAYGTSFVLNKDEWEQLKAFIDGQYKQLEE